MAARLDLQVRRERARACGDGRARRYLRPGLATTAGESHPCSQRCQIRDEDHRILSADPRVASRSTLRYYLA